jgi:hypothetical protein
MDKYYYKYLKYKKKYLDLSNQQGSANNKKYTEEYLINLITTAKNYNKDYITNPETKEPIHIDRAILINGTIYDSVLLLQDIINNSTKYVNSIDSKKFKDILDKTSDNYYDDISDTRKLMDILHNEPDFDTIKEEFLKS